MVFLERLYEEARESAVGKNWWIRAPLLFWFGYLLMRYLQNPQYQSVFSALNLGIHELGHLVFAPLGEFMGTAGGTILQVLAPLGGMINFYRQHDFFSIAFCFGWLSTNCFEVARYVADARSMELPLVSPFGGFELPIHDWNYILSRLGLLRYDMAVAFFLKIAGSVAMFICIGAGAWMLVLMAREGR